MSKRRHCKRQYDRQLIESTGLDYGCSQLSDRGWPNSGTELIFHRTFCTKSAPPGLLNLVQNLVYHGAVHEQMRKILMKFDVEMHCYLSVIATKVYQRGSGRDGVPFPP